MKFYEVLNLALNESVIDWTRSGLDHHLFDGNNELKEETKVIFNRIIDSIDKNIIKVNDYFIKGSILSYQWLDSTDIDILIEIDESINDLEWRHIQDKIDEKYEVDFMDTKHPLQIFAFRGSYDHGNADGLYDINKGWIKGPYSIKVNTNDYMDKFAKVVSSIDLETGELKRDVIDYKIMRGLPIDEVVNIKEEMQNKLDEINEDVKKMVDKYAYIKDLRQRIFGSKMSSRDLIMYGTKNSLPDNVIYKLLERYHYKDFMSNLKDVYENKINKYEVDDVENIISKI